MKNERLTIYGGNGEHYESINPIDTPYEYGKINLQKLIDKLAEYEDSEEQGLLLRLPCAVGSTVYSIHRLPSSKKLIVAEVEDVDMFFLLLTVTRNEFGKTVFLTQSEAEEKLRELGESRKKNVYKLQKESTTD